MPMLQRSMTARGSSKCELLLGASRGAKHSDHIEFVDKYKINYELMYGSNVSSFASVDRFVRRQMCVVAVGYLCVDPK